MANVFFSAGAERALRVNQLFGRIAPRYDLINDLQSLGLHRVWKRRVVRLACGRPGDRVLDICCGTGDVTLGLAGRGAVACGVDFNLPMLGVAVRKGAGRERLAGEAKFLCGDARRVPFADDTFDAVTISYGLRNLPSVGEGLAEMWRVLRPGGRMVILDFGWPRHPLWRVIYRGYLRFGVPLFGWLFCGDSQAYAYILESLEQYPAQEGVAAELRRLGCTRVRVINLLGGVMSIHEGVKPANAPSANRADALPGLRQDVQGSPGGTPGDGS